MSPQTFQTISRVMRQTSKSWQSSSPLGRLGEMAAAPAGYCPFLWKIPLHAQYAWQISHKNPHVFINLCGKICDDLGQQLASRKSDHLGNVFEELKLHREPNDPAAAPWVRQPLLRPAQVGMKSRHIVPLLIISLREKQSKCLTSPNICIQTQA